MVEELAATAVSLLAMGAGHLGTRLFDRVADQAEDAAAERLSRLRTWVRHRLSGPQDRAALDRIERSESAQTHVRERLTTELQHDRFAALELERLVTTARGAALSSGALGIDHNSAPAGTVFTAVSMRLPEQSKRWGHFSAVAQVPRAPADFAGRAPDLRRIREALCTPESGGGVCVLYGPGGIGKTATALAAAAAVAEDFPDGQLFVDLRGLDARPADPRGVLGEFLRALGVGPQAIPPDLDQLAARLRSELSGRRLLVVLDNAAGEAQLEPLLPGSSPCAVLITSRTPLPLLAVTTRVQMHPLAAEEGAALLTGMCGPERFATAADAEAIERIVQLCGGLPLALRLAGARLTAFPHRPVDRLARDLADEHTRLSRLSFGDVEVRSVFTDSYRACSPLQRRAFRLLSKLDAPDFPAWLLAPLLGVDEATAAKCLEHLLLAQLVLPGEAADGSVERIRLHDLARLFARERLAEEAAQSPEEEAETKEAMRRAAGTYLACLEIAEEGVRPAGRRHNGRSGAARLPVPAEAAESARQDPIGWFDTERRVLLAAVSQSHAARWWQLCWELTDAMSVCLECQSRWSDSLQAHSLALEAAEHLDNPVARAATLRNLGEILRNNGSGLTTAEAYLAESITLFQAAGDIHGLGDAIGNLAILHRHQGRFTEAAAGYQRAEELLRALPLERGLAWILRGRATIARQRGDHAQAAAALAEAISLFRANNDPRGVGWALRSRADLRVSEATQGAPLPRHWRCDFPWWNGTEGPADDAALLEVAAADYASAADLLTGLDNTRGVLWVRLGQAETALHRRDSATAHRIADEVAEVSEQLADQRALGRALSTSALALAELGEADRGVAAAERALRIHREVLPDRAGEALATVRLSRLYGIVGHASGARQMAARACALYRSCGIPLPHEAERRLVSLSACPITGSSRNRRRNRHAHVSAGGPTQP